MGTLYMVRHGQASFGEENYDRLSPIGQEQSRILAAHFLETGMKPDALYSGDMQRHKDTAQAMIDLYRQRDVLLPPIRIETAFNEYSSREIVQAYLADRAEANSSRAVDFKELTRDRKAFQRLFEKIVLDWVRGAFAKPGIATWESFRGRVAEGLKKIIAQNGRGRSILLFTSGGPISATLQLCLGLSDENTLRTAWQIANGSVTRFLYNGERLTLAGFNAIDHLALRKEPALVTYR